MITGEKMLDIFWLDDRLHDFGYDEDKDGSMEDYLLANYGEEVVELIKKLI